MAQVACVWRVGGYWKQHAHQQLLLTGDHQQELFMASAVAGLLHGGHGDTGRAPSKHRQVEGRPLGYLWQDAGGWTIK